MKRRVSLITALVLVAAAPVAAQDWSGFYVGAGAGTVGGRWQHVDDATGLGYNDGDYTDGTMLSLFGGYNLQEGDVLYGAELSIGQTNGLCFEEYLDECSDNAIDLKGRFGLIADRALIFGVLGMSTMDYHYNATTFTLQGLNYGVGLDYLVTDKLFVGGEVLRRNLAEEDYVSDASTRHDFTTLTLRLGTSF